VGFFRLKILFPSVTLVHPPLANDVHNLTARANLGMLDGYYEFLAAAITRHLKNEDIF
jgi:hypothetical protein